MGRQNEFVSDGQYRRKKWTNECSNRNDQRVLIYNLRSRFIVKVKETDMKQNLTGVNCLKNIPSIFLIPCFGFFTIFRIIYHFSLLFHHFF